MIFTALTVAGSDPSGGAGIQADLKTFSALGVYGMSAVTALTAQNTTGVTGVHLAPAPFVGQQIETVFADVRVNALKIGMIATADIAGAIADTLAGISVKPPIIVDPVMVAKGGAKLLDPSAVATLVTRILPLANIVTPNLPEAAALLDAEVATTPNDMVAQGQALLGLGPKAVLLKGGHLSGDTSPDLLVTSTETHWFESRRVHTQNTHGTGCTLSAAITAKLATGMPLVKAVESAKTYVQGAIANADHLNIGQGHGPTHHFHAIWSPKGDT